LRTFTVTFIYVVIMLNNDSRFCYIDVKYLEGMQWPMNQNYNTKNGNVYCIFYLTSIHLFNLIQLI